MTPQEKIALIKEKLDLIEANAQKVSDAGTTIGHNEERKAFWDAMQDYGNRTDYSNAFRTPYWDSRNFKPVYDFNITNAGSMFRVWNLSSGATFDLVEQLKSCGVKLNTSNCTNFAAMFNSASDISHVGELDIRKNTSVSYMFAYSFIYTIDKLIVDENTNLVDIFAGYNQLKNILFEGSIGKSIDFSACTKLTLDSMINTIEHLKDFKAENSNHIPSTTLAFADECWDLLENSERRPPKEDTWANYIKNLGWLVASTNADRFPAEGG